MNLKPIKIGRKIIGSPNLNSYVIAEIGSNFDGSLVKAKKLIRLAKESGADAAKFQSFITEKILSKKGFEKKLAFQSRWNKPVWDVYKKAELPLAWLEDLNQYCKKIGIDFLSTPYHFEAVDKLVKLGVPAIKIGSGELTNLEFLKYVGRTKKPILLATGASTLKEVSEAVKAIKSIGNNRIILMQTITQYPSPIEEANLRVLQTFQKKFGYNVGYSDHSQGETVVLGSIALGACVIEKHFTDNPKLNGPDHSHSMDPRSFKEMVKKIRYLEKALGNGIKKVEPSEKETRVIQRRGIWTVTEIKKGSRFNLKNITPLRPVVGVPASYLNKILGKKAKKNLRPFEPVQRKDF